MLSHAEARLVPLHFSTVAHARYAEQSIRPPNETEQVRVAADTSTESS
jgi:hypothetical protein